MGGRNLTTVATSLKEMASDTLAIDEGIPSKAKKIFRVKDKLVGFAGAMTDGYRFLDWVCAGSDKDDFPDIAEPQGFHGLVLSKSGILLYEDCATPIPVEEGCYAIGSGRQAAMAVLRQGGTPRQAIKAAMTVDIYTGGKIEVKLL